MPDVRGGVLAEVYPVRFENLCKETNDMFLLHRLRLLSENVNESPPVYSVEGLLQVEEEHLAVLLLQNAGEVLACVEAGLEAALVAPISKQMRSYLCDLVLNGLLRHLLEMRGDRDKPDLVDRGRVAPLGLREGNRSSLVEVGGHPSSIEHLRHLIDDLGLQGRAKLHNVAVKAVRAQALVEVAGLHCF